MKERRFRPADSVAARAVDDKIMFLEFHSGEFFEASGVGAQVWALLEQGLTLGEIEDLLCARYPEAGVSIALDIEAFLQELLRRGLLVPMP